MEDRSGKQVNFPAATPESPKDTLTEVLRQGARKMLAEAIEAEVADYLQYRKHLLDEVGHRVVVRNGHLPERQLQTPLGAILVDQPSRRPWRGSRRKASPTARTRMSPPRLAG